MRRPSPRRPDREFARPVPRGPRRPRGPWKNGPVAVVGLVGGIGAGKSLVAAQFAEQGAFVIDADAVGHALLRQRPAHDEVVHRFGPEILGPPEDDGIRHVDRRALGRIVFEDRHAMRALEEILHPRMRKTFEKAIGREGRRGKTRVVVLDAAILFEAGWNELCDRVIFVDAPREARVSRLAASRGWDEATVDAREAMQMPLPVKRGKADAVFENVGAPSEVAAKVDEFLKALRPPRRPRVPEAAVRGPLDERDRGARFGPNPGRPPWRRRGPRRTSD